MNFQIEETIAADRETVFARFTDIEAWPRMIEGIKNLDRMGETGPLQTGSQFQETRVMFGKEATETFTVTQLTSGETFTLRSESCGAEFICRHTFKPLGEDQTRITLDIQSKPLTTVARLMSPLGLLMKGTMRKCMQKDLMEMKAACEAAAV